MIRWRYKNEPLPLMQWLPELSRGNWAKIREERVLRKTKRITLLDDVRTPAVCCLHFPIFIHLPKASNDFYEAVHILIKLAVNNNLILLDLMLMTLKSNAALTIAFVIHVLTHLPSNLPTCHSSAHSLTNSPTHSPIFPPLLLPTYQHVLSFCSWAFVPLPSLWNTVCLWMMVWYSYLS